MQKYYEIETELGTMRGFFHKPDVSQFPVCIIFHGFTGQCTGTKFSYVQLSRMLEKQNIGSLRMDFLGSGQSDLPFRDMTFENELDSAIKIFQEVKNMDCVTEIYLLGHSMGGAIASEVAKRYPQDISKMCLWAPALNLPEAIEYLKGHVDETPYYDHSGFEISHAFVEDITSRDLYHDLDIYQNDLMILHGTKDATVPYDISKKYLKGFSHPVFYPIEGATHNYDSLEHINQVIQLTYHFLTNNGDE
ncbi:lysophospholipase [Allocoprobacillus halotolerans]|uniref:Lysophospholipase n=1 Tax=Allocoprobacillus halotolerans TaxID=2944914 RepID=A0ABY5I588_9FIRM|nr:alpha/beta fold hydrolase [Allocoprobacillus halotolerans]UTY40135.1 lysophospholipase [Allocoprobacillus halotolerans]